QFGDVLRQPEQYRQEGDQRHYRIDQAYPQPLHRRGESHRVFLYALRGALDVAKPWPVAHVVVVHRRAPAEDVVADEEAREHAHRHRDEGDPGECDQLAVEIGNLDGRRLGQRCLDQVVERAVPVVDGDAYLDLEIG